jgi:hypothetical protein
MFAWSQLDFSAIPVSISAVSLTSLCSFSVWGEVSNSLILNDIGRNFLLGNRKKIAKCLMRTFTMRQGLET